MKIEVDSEPVYDDNVSVCSNPWLEPFPLIKISFKIITFLPNQLPGDEKPSCLSSPIP